jgi:hypothetical protein
MSLSLDGITSIKNWLLPMLATAVNIETVPRAIMFATNCADEARRGHMRLNVIADILARAAGLSAEAAQVGGAVGGLAEQGVNAGFQFSHFAG